MFSFLTVYRMTILNEGIRGLICDMEYEIYNVFCQDATADTVFVTKKKHNNLWLC